MGQMYFRSVCLTQILHILYLNFSFFLFFSRIVAKLDFFFVSGKLCFVKIVYLTLLTMDSKGFVDFLC